MIDIVEGWRQDVLMDERYVGLGWMKQEWRWKMPGRCRVGWAMKRESRMKRTRHHSKPGRTGST